jgi:hypothetical protein
VSENFTLSFLYKGVPQIINCNLRVSAYTYQLICSTGQADLIVEKDDEGNLRVLEIDPNSKNNKRPEPAFIKVLVEEMERILQ